jgi:membrane-associated phospholipid phosphatase
MGFLPTWLMVGAALGLADRGRVGGGGVRAWALVVGAGLSGLAAEVLKRLIGRERPVTGEHVGTYFYKPFLHGLVDDHNLGIPSSHAAVAFGAAFVMVRVWPRIWPVAVLAGVGCAAQRVMAGAHFMTDVYAAVVIAYAVTAWLFGRWFAPAGRDAGL